MSVNDKFRCLLNEILAYAEKESEKIASGIYSEWNKTQLNAVYAEVHELLSYVLEGQVYYKYGKRQRMLESTYIMTDALAPLNQTPLGIKISELQKVYNSM